jgi:hypothetical protein
MDLRHRVSEALFSHRQSMPDAVFKELYDQLGAEGEFGWHALTFVKAAIVWSPGGRKAPALTRHRRNVRLTDAEAQRIHDGIAANGWCDPCEIIPNWLECSGTISELHLSPSAAATRLQEDMDELDLFAAELKIVALT